ncbi:MAG: Hpt domain-containing protein [Terracidiphilus sp.]|jgi:HPt (histidine-containing phosphotransfer) domain-containing protein
MESTGQPGVAAEAALAQAIDKLWVRFLPEIRERVTVLEAAASAVAATKLSAAGREAAKAAAHKLAGVLGTFSLTRGTDLARELEVTYSHKAAPSPADGERLAGLAAELRNLVEHRAPSA